MDYLGHEIVHYTKMPCCVRTFVMPMIFCRSRRHTRAFADVRCRVITFVGILIRIPSGAVGISMAVNKGGSQHLMALCVCGHRHTYFLSPLLLYFHFICFILLAFSITLLFIVMYHIKCQKWYIQYLFFKYFAHGSARNLILFRIKLPELML
jgi:hypothetical protein